jgi:hypothetical protein
LPKDKDVHASFHGIQLKEILIEAIRAKELKYYYYKNKRRTR